MTLKKLTPHKKRQGIIAKLVDIPKNQKRFFDDIGIFYAEYDVSQLKTIPVSTLDSIPTGEVVE